MGKGKQIDYLEEDDKESASERRARIIDVIERSYTFLTFRNTEELLHFDPSDGQWHDGVSYLNEFTRKLAGQEYTTNLFREVKAAVMVDTYTDPDKFKSPADWINLKNGALNILKTKFIRRDPEPDFTKMEDEIRQLKVEMQKKLKGVKDTQGTEESDRVKDSIRKDYNSRIGRKMAEITKKKQEWRKTQTEKFARFCFTSTLPIRYDPSATCPKIDQFFHQIQEGDDNVIRLYELTGYLLYKAYPLKKIFILYGEHDTGKTTLATELWQKMFIGSDGVSSLSIQSIQDDKFDRIKLRGKYANISPELPENTYIKDTSLFKALTGNDMISARLMHSQRDVKFVNFAKIIFLTNHMPWISESDDAFFSRVEIFEFPHVFGDDANTNIIQEIATDSELSGLLNLSVKALQELLKRGKFTASKEVEDKKEEYMLRANPVMYYLQVRYGFYHDYPEAKTPDDFLIKKSDVYSDYISFCQQKKITPKTQNKFFRIANRYFREMGIEGGQISHGSPEYYIGIYYKEYLHRDNQDKDK